jgi:hypothetical protein
MFAARVLPTVVVTILLISGTNLRAEAVQTWRNDPVTNWPGQPTPAGEQPSAPVSGRYRPWSSVNDGFSPPRAGDALGQRTWTTLGGAGGRASLPTRQAKPKSTPPPPSAQTPGSIYGEGIYAGYGTSFGYLGFYGSPYLGLPGNGLGYSGSSLLGLGGVTPWVLPW